MHIQKYSVDNSKACFRDTVVIAVSTHYRARDYLLSLGTLLAADSPAYYNVYGVCVCVRVSS